MHPGNDLLNRLVWATRGRSWGFRFLLDGGLQDPLTVYERCVADLGDAAAAWDRSANAVAIRLPDPAGRRDASGRLIPHEFVLLGPCVEEINSVEDGLRLIWPLVAEFYASVWEAERPPARYSIGHAKGGAA